MEQEFSSINFSEIILSLTERVDAMEHLLENLILRDAHRAFYFNSPEQIPSNKVLSLLELKKMLGKMNGRVPDSIVQKLNHLPDTFGVDSPPEPGLVKSLLEVLQWSLRSNIVGEKESLTVISDESHLNLPQEVPSLSGANRRDDRIFKEVYESILYEGKIQDAFEDLKILKTKYSENSQIDELYFLSLHELNPQELLQIISKLNKKSLIASRIEIEILGEEGNFTDAYDKLEKFFIDFPNESGVGISLEAYLLFLEWRTISKGKLLDLALKMIQKMKDYKGFPGYVRNLILLSKGIIKIENLPDSLEAYYKKKLISKSRENIFFTRKIFKNSIGIEFVYIPPGEFMMGALSIDEEALDNEKPQHKVSITKGFYMAKFPTTQGEWFSLMGTNPSDFKDSGIHAPVDNVSYELIQIFIKKLNFREGRPREKGYRLPTEAEWEYACRGGTQHIYSYGDDPDLLAAYAYFKENSEGLTHPVGEKKPNSFGLFDMHGQVWEWCEDWYDENYYSSSPIMDPKGPSSGKRKTLRGGAYNLLSHRIRASSRDSDETKTAFNIHGFRLVLPEDSI